MKCTHDPKTLKGQPIGVCQCPECGAMVIAGIDYPFDGPKNPIEDEFQDPEERNKCQFREHCMGEEIKERSKTDGVNCDPADCGYCLYRNECDSKKNTN